MNRLVTPILSVLIEDNKIRPSSLGKKSREHNNSRLFFSAGKQSPSRQNNRGVHNVEEKFERVFGSRFVDKMLIIKQGQSAKIELRDDNKKDEIQRANIQQRDDQS